MSSRPRLAGGAVALALALATAAPAHATLLTTSFATFSAALAGQTVTETQTTGLYGATSVSAIPLADGTVGILPAVDPAQPFSGFGGFFGDPNYAVDLFPTSIYVTSETLTLPGSISAFGFYVAPVLGTGDTITVTLSNGQTAQVTIPGLDPNTFVAPTQFFGFAGGNVSSITITSAAACTATQGGADCGFVIGDFFDVPEPASLGLFATALLAGAAAVQRRRRG
jgi:hypothetical protein